MTNELFKGLFDSAATRVISTGDFLLCIGISLLLGLIAAGGYAYKNKYTGSFISTLALLPSMVCVVIMMVNGNIGAGAATAGAFGLIRFRSVPGTAKEISAIFLAMAAGLIAGMGYLAYAVLFTVILSLMMMLCSELNIRGSERTLNRKTLRITIPEDLDYEGVFDDIFGEFTSSCRLIGVKTVNMGSLFRLTYEVDMKTGGTEKTMLDKLRERNGNLEITVSKREADSQEL